MICGMCIIMYFTMDNYASVKLLETLLSFASIIRRLMLRVLLIIHQVFVLIHHLQVV